MPSSGILAEPVLVGREKELGELQALLSSAIEGKGKTVFISGEAGSGKTRLTQEFLKILPSRNVTLLKGGCLNNVAVPYFPFLEAFKTYFAFDLEEGWLNSLQRTSNSQGREAVDAETWKDKAFASVAQKVHVICENSPLVLLIEDIQWADSASLGLLHYISQFATSEKLLLLATYRNDELTIDDEGRPHPLVRELRLMRREELISEITIQRLSHENVLNLAEKMVGGKIQLELADKLAHESRGNALFVVESLRMLFERKALVNENNEWQLAGSEIGIPSKIKDIILGRLAILKFSQRRILDAAAVIGEKFDVELLSTVLEKDVLEVLESLSFISQSTSIVCADGPFYRFDHAKSRETLYKELPLPLKRGYHAKIAAQLEARNDRLPLADLAYHFAQAENVDKAVKYSFAAGRDALSRWSNQEAIRNFEYILAVLKDIAGHSVEMTAALEGLGDAFYANGMFKDSARVYENLAEKLEGALKLRAFRKAMEASFCQGDDIRRREISKMAEPYLKEYAGIDRLEEARIKMWNADWVAPVQAGSIRSIRSRLLLYYEALQVFEEEYSLLDTADTLRVLGYIISIYAEQDRGLAASLRAVAIYNDVGNWSHQIEAYDLLGDAFIFCGLSDEAIRLYSEVFEKENQIRSGNYRSLIQMSAVLAFTSETFGDFDQAFTSSQRYLDYSRKTDSVFYLDMVCGVLARHYARIGDLKEAEKYLEELKKIPPQSGNWSVSLHLKLSMAVFSAEKGLWAESADCFKDCFEIVNSPGGFIFEMPVKTNYARALQKQGLLEKAKSLLEEIEVSSKANQKFEHVNLHPSLMVPACVEIGQVFEARLDIINVARTRGLVTKINWFIPAEFEVVGLPSFCYKENDSILLKDTAIDRFQDKPLKIGLQAIQTGTFVMTPIVGYVNDLGEAKMVEASAKSVTVKPAFETLPERKTTGTRVLDDLLLGGLPEGYAAVINAPLSDEREQMVKRFVTSGIRGGETIILLSCNVNETKEYAFTYRSNFFSVVCNSEADSLLSNLPNIFKLKGVDNLTDIDISLTKLLRELNPMPKKSVRVCIDLLSDVLLQHHAIITRRWLSSLLSNFKARGFNVLGVINPLMHPIEETQAITSVFEGEIAILEKPTGKTLAVRRLANQRYLADELPL